MGHAKLGFFSGWDSCFVNYLFRTYSLISIITVAGVARAGRGNTHHQYQAVIW